MISLLALWHFSVVISVDVVAPDVVVNTTQFVYRPHNLDDDTT
jgi:hypothetical protein